MPEIKVLGRKIRDGKIIASESRPIIIEALRKLPVTVKDLRSSLGITQGSSHFIPNYAEITSDLNKLTATRAEEKNSKKIAWTDQTKAEYAKLVDAVSQINFLHAPTKNEPFHVQTDASNKSTGAVLYQLINGEKRVIDHLSQPLTETQRRWTTIEIEAYAIVRAITSWRRFLLPNPFTIYTDHRNLTFILRSETQKLTRWRLALQEYVFNIVHIKGEENVVADALSRISSP